MTGAGLPSPDLCVSFVMVAKRWDGWAEKAIESVLAQTIPTSCTVEVVVALQEIPEQGLPGDVRVVANPTGRIPAGLCRAIEAAHGGVIARVDSRCVLPPGYLETAVALLSGDESIGCVGGPAIIQDVDLVGSAYAVCFNGGLVGPSQYRVSTRAGFSDTVYLGVWPRRVLDAVGGFDERMVRNQDNELASRIRAAGFRIRYEPSMGVGYWSARGVNGLLRHHFDFGLWRGLQVHLGNRGLERKHWQAFAVAALAGVVALVAASIAPRLVVAAAIVAGYLVASVVATECTRRVRRATQLPDTPRLRFVGAAAAPLLALALDSAWLGGLVAGVFRRPARRRRGKSVGEAAGMRP